MELFERADGDIGNSSNQSCALPVPKYFFVHIWTYNSSFDQLTSFEYSIDEISKFVKPFL